MYRIVLNGESHLEVQTRSIKDMNYFSSITKIEKQKICQDVLSFMLLLNKVHLKKQLLNEDLIRKIEGWSKAVISEKT